MTHEKVTTKILRPRPTKKNSMHNMTQTSQSTQTNCQTPCTRNDLNECEGGHKEIQR